MSHSAPSIDVNSPTAMLNISQLCKTYADGTRALDNLSLTLPSGMIGLLGANGAGKSSLLRTLACLQAADSGEVHFAGINVRTQPQQIRKLLGYLPQEFGVYPHFSCRALLAHIAALKGLTRHAAAQQIEQLLALTHLTQFANKPVSQFSGGMRQRFGIAQALLGDPKLLILDEPTAGLDPQEREHLHSVLLNLSEQRMVLLSTHIVEDIENLCHFVALQRQGRIVSCGPVPTLLAPLQGQIWLSPEPATAPSVHSISATAAPVSPAAVTLSKQFQYGQLSYRVFSAQSPHPLAVRCPANLQDCYFLANTALMSQAEQTRPTEKGNSAQKANSAQSVHAAERAS